MHVNYPVDNFPKNSNYIYILVKRFKDGYCKVTMLASIQMTEAACRCLCTLICLCVSMCGMLPTYPDTVRGSNSDYVHYTEHTLTLSLLSPP